MVDESVKRIIEGMPTPPHDETSDGIVCKCWCSPKVIAEGGAFIFVHNDLIDREELKIRIRCKEKEEIYKEFSGE